MSRLALIAAVAVLSMLGFGSAFVFAKSGSGGKGGGDITICHSRDGKRFSGESASAEAVVRSHGKNHEHDIVPPFELIANGTTSGFPGQNLNTIYGAGVTGAEVLANHCHVPAGSTPSITETTRVTTTESVLVTATVGATKVTEPAATTATQELVTVSVQAVTTAASPATTVVTVPPGETTTVTVPARTVTMPVSTETLPGETVVRPAETVTLPPVTTTVTAAGTTTVVTVTAPSEVVREGVVIIKRVHVIERTPPRVIRVAGRVVRVRARGRFIIRTVTIVVIRYRNCPPGSTRYRNTCSAIVHGKG